jgi:hypothetical protein
MTTISRFCTPSRVILLDHLSNVTIPLKLVESLGKDAVNQAREHHGRGIDRGRHDLGGTVDCSALGDRLLTQPGSTLNLHISHINQWSSKATECRAGRKTSAELPWGHYRAHETGHCFTPYRMT